MIKKNKKISIKKKKEISYDKESFSFTFDPPVKSSKILRDYNKKYNKINK